MSLVDIIGIKFIIIFAVSAPFIFLLWFSLGIEDKKERMAWILSILYAEIFMVFFDIIVGMI